MHLLFADDSLLFFRAKRGSANEVKELLNLYYRQQINNDKSSIYFAKGCCQSLREELKHILEVHNES